jgi:hypothetical protein
LTAADCLQKVVLLVLREIDRRLGSADRLAG